MALGSRWGMGLCALALLLAWGGCQESVPQRPEVDMGDRHDTPPLSDRA